MNIMLETLDIVLPSNSLKTAQKNLTLGEIDQIEDAVNNWMIALHWVIKLDWDSKHKVPTTRAHALALKPLGEYLYQTFLLCAAIHARRRFLPFELPYGDGYEWFILICKEKIGEIKHDVTNPRPRKNSNVITYNGDEKRRIIRECLDNPGLVEKGKNPLKNNLFLPNTNLLIDAAIEFSISSSEFKNRYLKPYTTAWRAALKEMESSRWQRQFVKNEELYRMRSGSKSTRNVTAEKYYKARKLAGQGLQALPAKSL